MAVHGDKEGKNEGWELAEDETAVRLRDRDRFVLDLPRVPDELDDCPAQRAAGGIAQHPSPAGVGGDRLLRAQREA